MSAGLAEASAHFHFSLAVGALTAIVGVLAVVVILAVIGGRFDR